MTIKVGINGFGRMGRLSFAPPSTGRMWVVRINDPAGDAASLAPHHLRFSPWPLAS